MWCVQHYYLRTTRLTVAGWERFFFCFLQRGSSINMCLLFTFGHGGSLENIDYCVCRLCKFRVKIVRATVLCYSFGSDETTRKRNWNRFDSDPLTHFQVDAAVRRRFVTKHYVHTVRWTIIFFFLLLKFFLEFIVVFLSISRFRRRARFRVLDRTSLPSERYTKRTTEIFHAPNQFL